MKLQIKDKKWVKIFSSNFLILPVKNRWFLTFSKSTINHIFPGLILPSRADFGVRNIKKKEIIEKIAILRNFILEVYHFYTEDSIGINSGILLS